MGTFALLFRRRYNLAPTDPRFLDATEEEMIVDFYANQYQDRRDKGEPDMVEDEDDDFDLEQVLAEAEANGAEWEEVGGDEPGN